MALHPPPPPPRAVGGGPRIIPVAGAAAPTLPGGGLTLDALMARQKELAGRTVEMPEMRSPWQGVAYAAQQGLQGFQAGRAERDAQQGRDALAAAIAQIDPNTGQMPPEAMAAMAALEPDQAMQMQMAQIAARRAEANRAEDRTWRVEDREDAQRAADAAQAAGFAHADTSQQQGFEHADTSQKAGFEHTDAAAELARQQAVADAEKKAAADVAGKKRRQLTPEETAKGGYAPGTVVEVDDYGNAEVVQAAPPKLDDWQDVVVPGQPITQQRNAKTNELRSVQKQTTGADRKAMWAEQDAYVNTASSASALKRAHELLGKGIHTGYTAGAKTFGSKAFGIGDEETTKRTDEYNRIMNQEAIAAMSSTLKGATTDTELQEFIKNMNDPTIDPDIKKSQIERMMTKVDAFQRLQQARITDLGGDVPRVDEPVPSASADLPSGVTEEDIKFTMEQRNMTREQVLTELKKRAGANAP